MDAMDRLLDAFEKLGTDLRDELKLQRAELAKLEKSLSTTDTLLRGQVGSLQSRVIQLEGRCGTLESEMQILRSALDSAKHEWDSALRSAMRMTGEQIGLVTTEVKGVGGEIALVKKAQADVIAETRQQTAILKQIAAVVITPSPRTRIIVAVGLFIGATVGGMYLSYRAGTSSHTASPPRIEAPSP